MPNRKLSFLIPIVLGSIVLVSAVFLWPEPASAQCGSQASSCKNCHEVQGKDPVNADGTGWHQSHAFGDFCYLCHAGNNQSMVEEEAHAGMVPPLSDVKAACQQCHPADLMERSQVYASLLGVEIGTGGGAPATGGGTTTTPSQPAEAAPESPAMVVESSDVVDYNQQYDETVLGKRTTNWGNVIVSLMIAGMGLGGGAFIFYNERKIRGLPFLPTPKVAQKATTELAIPKVEGYSDEIAALLPKIARLSPVGLHALKGVLENPDQANELLHSLSRLDPELLRRIRNLDRQSRELLLAISGD